MFFCFILKYLRFNFSYQSLFGLKCMSTQSQLRRFSLPRVPWRVIFFILYGTLFPLDDGLFRLVFAFNIAYLFAFSNILSILSVSELPTTFKSLSVFMPTFCICSTRSQFSEPLVALPLKLFWFCKLTRRRLGEDYPPPPPVCSDSQVCSIIFFEES